jgi:hypothetical protein
MMRTILKTGEILKEIPFPDPQLVAQEQKIDPVKVSYIIPSYVFLPN